MASCLRASASAAPERHRSRLRAARIDGARCLSVQRARSSVRASRTAGGRSGPTVCSPRASSACVVSQPDRQQTSPRTRGGLSRSTGLRGLRRESAWRPCHGLRRFGRGRHRGRPSAVRDGGRANLLQHLRTVRLARPGADGCARVPCRHVSAARDRHGQCRRPGGDGGEQARTAATTGGDVLPQQEGEFPNADCRTRASEPRWPRRSDDSAHGSYDDTNDNALRPPFHGGSQRGGFATRWLQSYGTLTALRSTNPAEP
ncbi:MAG: hypothetical protein RL199_2115 [Pseudomonadota bacterium]|jgi:hypothetical protein